MNELIRKLSEQARKYARDYVADCKHYGYYMEHNEYDLQFEEMFVELIVRECMELGDKALQDGKWPGDVIEKHFGVKDARS